MIYNLKIFLGIFFILAVSRFIPHPPNFTSLIALSFYVPLFFGKRFITAVIVSFALTDIIIGFHTSTLFTWGSVLLIGLLSSLFNKSLSYRICGALTGAVVFYLVTNFGVWVLGSYNFTLNGLLTSYYMAIPFFGYSLVSSIFFALLIEASCLLIKKKLNLKILKN